MPPGVPVGQSWHAVRDGVMDKVYEILGGDGGPAVAALTGRSGAGKTTAAAAMVGERQGPIRPRAGETEDQTRTRLDRVRARFSDGVVWLRVGKGEGVADRLPPLMHKLAKALHEDVMDQHVDSPEVGEDGASYVKRIVELKRKRCLVVADDVWEEEVVQKLRETGLWVLLTTRTGPKVGVEPNERVVVDKLNAAEAEDVLRGAARLPPGQRLCDAAADVLEMCGFTAMDIAFVGRWDSVRTTHGVPMSREAWARTLREIIDQKATVENAGEIDDLDVNRLAVLRAGFEFIASENVLAGKLYAMLAVFPHGHAFGRSDAGVLLDHKEEVATGPISMLERWAVLKQDALDKYSMHDAHVDFARGMLDRREDLRKLAVHRWTSHISRLDFAVGIDLYALLDMWRVLEFKVKGEGWFVSRPYDDQLVQMDATSRSKPSAVDFVAKLFDHDQKFGELEALMQRVLNHCDDHGEGSPEVQMTALHHTRQSLLSQGRYQESDDVKRRLGEMIGPSFRVQEPDCGSGFAQTSTTFHIYGVCAKAAGRLKDAEEWFRKALKVEEDGGHTASSQAVSTLHELGSCVRRAGRLGDAEELLKRALEIMVKAKLGSDHLYVARTLLNLSKCVLQAGRNGEAEELFTRVLGIKEAKLGADSVGVAVTLRGMGMCAREAGRLVEAEELCRRALKIKEAKMGADHPKVARTLHELGSCVRQAGRLAEAGELLERALEIREAKYGGDHAYVTATLHELGLCMRQAGRVGEAEELFRRALEIKEAKLGPHDVNVSYTLDEVGVCARLAGRLGEAEAVLKRALEIKKAKLEVGHTNVAWTLHEMGVCTRQAGRLGEAEALLKRALEIRQAKLGPGDVNVAYTLDEMGVCARLAGRLGEAEALLKRELEIEEAKLGSDDLTGFRHAGRDGYMCAAGGTAEGRERVVSACAGDQAGQEGIELLIACRR